MAKYQFTPYTIDYQRVKDCHFVVSECLSARISVRRSIISDIAILYERINWGLSGMLAL